MISPRKSLFFWLCLATAATALAASHHLVGASLLLPFVYVLFQKRRQLPLRNLALIPLLLIGIFFLPYLLLFLLNQHQVAVSWQFDATLVGWWQHITRAAFYGNVYASNQVVKNVIQSIDINQGIVAVGEYAKLTVLGFRWWILLPLLLIVQHLLNSPKPLERFFLLTYAATGLVVPFILRWSLDWGTQGTIMRQWYLGHIALVPLLAYGMLDLWLRWQKVSGMLFVRKSLVYIPAVVFLLGLGVEFYLNYPLLNFRSFHLVSDRYEHILKTVPTNSLVTCYSDTACFALLYEQSVTGLRPDVDIVPLQYHLVQPTLQKPDLKGFSYPSNPYLMLDVVTWNLKNRPVIAVELSAYYYNLYGIDIPFMYYLPSGYYGQLALSLPKTYVPAPADYELSEAWRSVPLSPLDPYRSFLASTPARDHLINAQIYLKMDQRQRALQELNMATNLFYRFSSQDKKVMTAVRTNMEQVQPVPAFAPGQSVPEAKTFLTYIPDLLKKKDNGRALKAAQGAVIVDPKNIPARLYLASFYREMGDRFFAKMEYLNVLQLDPSNKEALDKLAALDAQ